MDDPTAKIKLDQVFGAIDPQVAKAAATQLAAELKDLEERAARRKAEIILSQIYAQQAAQFPTSAQVTDYIVTTLNPKLGVSPPQV